MFIANYSKILNYRYNSHNVFLLSILFLVSFGLIFAPYVDSAFATWKPELHDKDWEGNKRILCYKFHSNVTEQWKTWIKEAITNWNNVKDKTGWEFQECAEGKKVDVKFTLRDNISGHGGAYVGTTNTKDGKSIKKADVHIDDDISGEKWPDGTVSTGWGTEGKDKQDPILVLKHELTHVMKLDHSAGGGYDTGNLEDPTKPGNHDNPKNRIPSANDIAEAKKAADHKGTQPNQTTDEQGDIIKNQNSQLVIPNGALDGDYAFYLEKLGHDRAPFSLNAKDKTSNQDHVIFDAVTIGSDYSDNFEIPSDLSIQYDESDLSTEFIPWIHHNSMIDTIDEKTISAYKFNNNTESWIEIPSEINTSEKIISFQIHELGTFGIGGSFTFVTPELTDEQISNNDWNMSGFPVLVVIAVSIIIISTIVIWRKRK